jgi:hypothetical protein
MSHLTFDRISAIAEGDAATPAERRHLDECLACIDQMSDVRSVLAIAKTLGDIAPPSDAWDGIRARVGIGKRTARRWPAGRWVAAAAAIIIVAGGALLLPLGNGGTNALKGAKVAQQPAPVAAAVERQFTQTLEVLSQTLDTQRPVLAKSVVVVVDKSLADIDAAISETRDALRADPENPALVDILSSHYERKVDLLQRATELASSS